LSSSSKRGLRRELGVILLTGLGIGSIIGSGIYANPGLITSVTGPLAIVAIIFMSIITSILMYIIAKLGVIYPKAGSIYYFAKEILGDLAGFITGLSYYVCCFVGTPAIIYAFIFYLSYYIPGVAVGLTLTPLGVLIALIILAIVTWINVIGVKPAAGLNFILTVLKILPLFVFIAIASIRFNANNFQPLAPFGFGSIGLAIAFGFWMFLGFESVVLVSEEVKEPEKTITKAAVATVVIVSLIYILVMATFMGSVNWSALGFAEKDWASLSGLSAPLADVSRVFGVPGLAELMTMGAVISTAGCFSAWVLLQGRVAFALAREERFWRPLAYIHPRYATPSHALIFSSILSAIIVLLIPSFPSVILIALIAEFIPYAISAISLTVLKRDLKLILLGYVAFVISSLYIYWACWPWTLTGTIIAIVSVILYPVFAKGVPYLSELKKNTWYVTYLIGLTVISLLGDPMFEYENFLPISPLGIFPIPYDAAVIAIFATIVFTYVYKIYSQKK